MLFKRRIKIKACLRNDNYQDFKLFDAIDNWIAYLSVKNDEKMHKIIISLVVLLKLLLLYLISRMNSVNQAYFINRVL